MVISCSLYTENLDSPDVDYKTIALLLSVMVNVAMVAFSEAELSESVLGMAAVMERKESTAKQGEWWWW